MLVCVDYDGTLADDGDIPHEHWEVVRQVRAAGHQVVLCTGRCRCMVPPEVLDEVDGLVGSSGGYVELGGQTLSDTRFPEPVAVQVLRLLDEAEVLYILEAPEAGYAQALMIPVLAEALRQALAGPEPVQAIMGMVRPLPKPAPGFAKIACFGAPRPLTELVDRLPAEVGLIPSSLPVLGPGAGEIFLRSLSKAAGVQTICRQLGVGPEQVVAVGDGHNDIELAEIAGTAVAVASGPPQLLARADLVVPGPAELGLVEAFTRLGLTG
ncbi:MAG: HAD family hydrolase [Actinomycetia bacterium]|nr:HAD family hydrolase [Actinomycetes bacterium]